jgi:electron transport complex protein RnfA
MLLLCLFCDNFLFIHGLGVKRLIATLNDEYSQFNAMKTAGLLSASSIHIFIYFNIVKLIFKLKTEGIPYAIIPFVLLICSLVGFSTLTAIIKLSKRKFRKMELLGVKLLNIFFDPLVWGINLICIYRSYDFFYSIFFLIVGCLGYVFCSHLIQFDIKYIKNNKIPKCMRGTPILFIYIGLLSLACFGVRGEQIYV